MNSAIEFSIGTGTRQPGRLPRNPGRLLHQQKIKQPTIHLGDFLFSTRSPLREIVIMIAALSLGLLLFYWNS